MSTISTYPNRHEFYRAWTPGWTIAEIGVEKGKNARWIWDLAKPAELWLIDAWKHDLDTMLADPTTTASQAIHNANYVTVLKEFIENPDVHVIKANSLIAVQFFPDRYFDAVYIDANHEREHVAADLAAWWPKVKTGRLLCGHDYLINRNSEVKLAVDAFCLERGVQINHLTTDAWPSWGIERPISD